MAQLVAALFERPGLGNARIGGESGSQFTFDQDVKKPMKMLPFAWTRPRSASQTAVVRRCGHGYGRFQRRGHERLAGRLPMRKRRLLRPSRPEAPTSDHRLD